MGDDNCCIYLIGIGIGGVALLLVILLPMSFQGLEYYEVYMSVRLLVCVCLSICLSDQAGNWRRGITAGYTSPHELPRPGVLRGRYCLSICWCVCVCPSICLSDQAGNWRDGITSGYTSCRELPRPGVLRGIYVRPSVCVCVRRATDKVRKSVITHWKSLKTHWKYKLGVKTCISKLQYALGVQCSVHWLSIHVLKQK